MRIEEHYENFMSHPDVEQYGELYCSILENKSNMMVEKTMTYSLHFDTLVILSDELHEMYLKESVYDDEEF